MLTGELVTFGILVVFVVVIALVGRRIQTVQPPPGAAPNGGDHKVDLRNGKRMGG
jgi:hypothetical protein